MGLALARARVCRKGESAPAAEPPRVRPRSNPTQHKGRTPMSRIPNNAIPHAWAEDSEHAKEVRRARGEERQGLSALKIAAIAGVGLIAARLLFGRFRHA